jgi:hypothetical protein
MFIRLARMVAYKVCVAPALRGVLFKVCGLRGRGMINDQQSLLITVDRTVDQRFVLENF